MSFNLCQLFCQFGDLYKVWNIYSIQNSRNSFLGYVWVYQRSDYCYRIIGLENIGSWEPGSQTFFVYQVLFPSFEYLKRPIISAFFATSVYKYTFMHFLLEKNAWKKCIPKKTYWQLTSDPQKVPARKKLVQKLPADRVPDDKVPAKRLQRRIGHWALTLVNGQLLCASL